MWVVSEVCVCVGIASKRVLCDGEFPHRKRQKVQDLSYVELLPTVLLKEIMTWVDKGNLKLSSAHLYHLLHRSVTADGNWFLSVFV